MLQLVNTVFGALPARAGALAALGPPLQRFFTAKPITTRCVMAVVVALAVVVVTGLTMVYDGMPTFFWRPRSYTVDAERLASGASTSGNPLPATWLEKQEWRAFSQQGEDGIINAIFDVIGVGNKYYVEFGVEDGTQCNTRYLRERQGWNGLQMDGSTARPAINKQQEFITKHNICMLFSKYQVPLEPDLLSIDIDLQDYWVLRKILSCKYSPRVIIAEVNTNLGPVKSITIPESTPDEQMWDGTNYHGMSLQAAAKLLHFNYTLVYVDLNGINAFFVRNDQLRGFKVPDADLSSWVAAKWRPARSTYFGAHRRDFSNRPFQQVP